MLFRSNIATFCIKGTAQSVVERECSRRRSPPARLSSELKQCTQSLPTAVPDDGAQRGRPGLLPPSLRLCAAQRQRRSWCASAGAARATCSWRRPRASGKKQSSHSTTHMYTHGHVCLQQVMLRRKGQSSACARMKTARSSQIVVRKTYHRRMARVTAG